MNQPDSYMKLPDIIPYYNGITMGGASSQDVLRLGKIRTMLSVLEGHQIVSLEYLTKMERWIRNKAQMAPSQNTAYGSSSYAPPQFGVDNFGMQAYAPQRHQRTQKGNWDMQPQMDMRGYGETGGPQPHQLMAPPQHQHYGGGPMRAGYIGSQTPQSYQPYPGNAVRGDFHTQQQDSGPPPCLDDDVFCLDGIVKPRASDAVTRECNAVAERFEMQTLNESKFAGHIVLKCRMKARQAPPLRLLVPSTYPQGKITVDRDDIDNAAFKLDEVQAQVHERLAMPGLRTIADFLDTWESTVRQYYQRYPITGSGGSPGPSNVTLNRGAADPPKNVDYDALFAEYDIRDFEDL
ncbi:hypothetical protein PMAYCL1PPCAC_32305 [Pristionchus mayeri]|uniref:ARC105/Med15 mediator subunit C-terminal domain-containing protein n=1 Tax=Pristionchus mayeri TaxID=1317129 RepID=A0AAN5DH77_9BILA|nr:hypothetical protein PMAYCL1PPCAC_32305 [Pristionchus mayeri]